MLRTNSEQQWTTFPQTDHESCGCGSSCGGALSHVFGNIVVLPVLQCYTPGEHSHRYQHPHLWRRSVWILWPNRAELTWSHMPLVLFWLSMVFGFLNGISIDIYPYDSKIAVVSPDIQYLCLMSMEPQYLQPQYDWKMSTEVWLILLNKTMSRSFFKQSAGARPTLTNTFFTAMYCCCFFFYYASVLSDIPGNTYWV